ncbi:MAG: hypothetical protein O7J95_03970, partial [Planctomycetota bacterium]|nr:hypothetical protein [Planctomycetota bacterium]
MRSLSLSVLLLVFGSYLPAGDECSGQLTATQEKIDKLLVRWEKASKSLASLTATERGQILGELSSVARTCPVGSRLGKTLQYASEALAATVKADEECRKSCSAEKTAKASAECEELDAAVAARSKLLRTLATLARYSTLDAGKGGLACCEGSGCDKSSGTLTLAQKGSGCETAKKVVVFLQKGSFCPEKAAKLAVAVRKQGCEKSAAKLLVSEIPGLSCEKAAAALL